VDKVTVIKRDHTGREVIRYPAEALERSATQIVVQASFSLEEVPVDAVYFRRGDRFVETYYLDRWYNLHQVFNREDGTFKCWYCNLAYPAVVKGDQISYRDLALDLLVCPDGRQVILDGDEFEALPISEDERAEALRGLEELQAYFQEKYES